jgi:hypothetical protein
LVAGNTACVMVGKIGKFRKIAAKVLTNRQNCSSPILPAALPVAREGNLTDLTGI